MNRVLLLAVTAGLMSAAVYLGGVTAGLGGSYFGIMLAYLSPAPLFAAALGLGGPAGVLAAIVGTVPVLILGGAAALFGYMALAAVPAGVLGRQAMLSRVDDQGETEWYPPGALAGWLFGIGAVIHATFSAVLGARPAGLSGSVEEMLTELAVRVQIPDDRLDPIINYLHPILPGTAIAFLLLVQVGNGALAQGLLVAGGRSIRPTPDFGALELPGWTAVAGAVIALAAIVLDGDLGYFARNLLIVATVPYFLQGLSVVHVLAARTGGGSMILAVFYVTLIVLGWVAVLIVLLGLVEQLVGFRQRLNRNDGA